MQKRYSFILLVLILLLQNCQSSTSSERNKKYLEQFKNKQAPLQVVSVSPEGALPNQPKQVIVHYSQPMVALQSLHQSQANSDFVEISPKPAGSFRWVNSRTLIFETKDGFDFATRYQVKVLAGQQSQLGYALLKEKAFEFETPRPKVLSVSPASSNKISFEPKLKVRFNQPIHVNDLQSKVKLEASGQSVEFRVVCDMKPDQNQSISTCQEFLVSPSQAFQPEKKVSLTVQKDLKPASGNLLMQKSFSVTYQTYGPLKLTKVSCYNICTPDSNYTIALSNPVDYKDVKDFIEFDPPAKINHENSYYSRYSKAISLYAEFKPNQKYKLILKPGFKDTLGQTLKEPLSHEFEVGHRWPYSGFVGYHSNSITPKSADIELGVKLRNILAGRLYIKKDFTQKDWMFLQKNRSHLSYDDVECSKALGVTEPVKTFKRSMDEEYHMHSLKAGQVFGTDLPDFVALCLEVEEPEAYRSASYHKIKTSIKMIQLTDLAVQSRLGREQGEIFVSSLKNNAAKAGAQVTVYNNDGVRLFSGKTNAKGFLQVPGLKDWEEAIQKTLDKDQIKKYRFYPLSIFAQTKSDAAMVNTDWELDYTWGVFPYRLDYKDGDEDARKTRIHLVTDRGLYKPGEKVHFKGFARLYNDGKFEPLTGEFEVKISGPRSTQFEPFLVTVNERGNFDFEFETKDYFKTGSYYVNLYKPEDKSQKSLGYTRFDVEFFRKPEFEIKIDSKRFSTVLAGQSVDVNFHSQYLFGQPLKNANFTMGFVKSVGSFYADGFEEWRFGRLYSHTTDFETELRKSLQESKGTLNVKGESSYDFKTSKDWIDPVQVSLWVNVKDVAGISIGQRSSFTVHPALGYVAAKVKDLFHKQSDPIAYEYKTLDLAGKEFDGLDVTELKLFQEEWVSVKKEGMDDAFETSYERQDKLIQSCEAATLKDKSCELFAKKSGYHFLQFKAKDKDGRQTVTEVPVYVYGGDFYPWMSQDTHVLDLELKNKNLKVGDQAEIFVKSPFRSGKLLVSIERDEVLSTQVIEFDGNLEPLAIPIKKEFVPNAFVRVVLMKGYDDIDPTQLKTESDVESFSILKSGTLELKVAPENKVLTVQAKPQQKIYNAGDEVTIDFEVKNLGDKQEAELTVMVVDEGVLQASGFSLKDPLDTLFRPFSHLVSLADSRKFFSIEKYALAQKAKKLSQSASGGGKDSMNRKNFVPLAYFNGALETEEGKAQVTFTLPDQMTKFRVMVIANSEVDRFGLAKADFISKKNLFVTTSFPSVMRWGDQIKTDLVVHNTSAVDQKVNVEFEAKELGLEFKQELLVKASTSQALPVSLRFDSQDLLKTILKTKTKTLVFATKASLKQNGQYLDQVEHDLTVQRKGIEHKFVMNDVLQDEAYEVVQKSDLDEPGMGGFKLSLESHLLGQLKFFMNELMSYPYSCLEQKVSRAYPIVLFYKQGLFFEGPFKEESYRQNYILDLLHEIQSKQNYNGSFGFWNRNTESAFVTTYLAGFIADVEKLGFDVKNVKEKVIKRLTQYITDQKIRARLSHGIGEDRLLVMSLYQLAKLGQPQTNYESNLVEVFDSLSIDLQAMIVEMFHDQDVQKALIENWEKSVQNKIVIKGKTARIEMVHRPFYYSGKEATASVVRTLLKIDPTHPFLFQLLRNLVQQKGLIGYRSSYALSETLKTIAAYQSVFPSQNESFDVNVSLNNEDLFEANLSPKRSTDHIDLPLSKLPKKMEFFLKKDGAQPVFYEMQLNTVAKNYRDYALEQGIFISRRFFDAKNNEVKASDLKEGEYYFVTLDLYFAHPMQSVVIDEPIASLFDPVHSRIKTSANTNTTQESSLNTRISYMDLRGDRIYFYFNSVGAGYYQLNYPVMVVQSGEAIIPPALAQDMYDQDVFGATGKQTVIVH